MPLVGPTELAVSPGVMLRAQVLRPGNRAPYLHVGALPLVFTGAADGTRSIATAVVFPIHGFGYTPEQPTRLGRSAKPWGASDQTASA